MKSTLRQQKMISLLEAHSPISIEQFVDEFKVTPTTIRRDLAILEQDNFITRSRGYAHIKNFPNMVGIGTRIEINKEEKQRIAKVALSLIEPHESIIFDSGTTTLALANQLRNVNIIERLNLVTDSIPIALALSDQYQVILPGGIYNSTSDSLIGPETEAYFHNITADTLFLSAPGVRESIGLTVSSPFAMAIKKQMIRASKRVVALIDSTKFDTGNLRMFCTFNEIDILITTETSQNAQTLKEIAAQGVKILLANDN